MSKYFAAQCFSRFKGAQNFPFPSPSFPSRYLLQIGAAPFLPTDSSTKLGRNSLPDGMCMEPAGGEERTETSSWQRWRKVDLCWRGSDGGGRKDEGLRNFAKRTQLCNGMALAKPFAAHRESRMQMKDRFHFVIFQYQVLYMRIVLDTTSLGRNLYLLNTSLERFLLFLQGSI